MSAEERRILTLVNRRRPRGSVTLRWSRSLHGAAREHNRRMLSSNSLTHRTNEQLNQLGSRLGYSIVGECLALGFTPNESENLVDSWMRSTQHRAAIENRAFEEAAVAVAGSGRNRYFTLLLGGRGPVISNLGWISSTQRGEEWTHLGAGQVSDNVDGPNLLRIHVVRDLGNITRIDPSQMPIRPNQDGTFQFLVIQRGMNTVTVRIYALDSRGNRSTEIHLRST